MKHTTLLAASALALSLSSAGASSVVDPSFEVTPGPGGPPFVGEWELFAGPAAGAGAGFATTNPLSGAQSLELSFISPDHFAGAFQDVFGVIPGNSYTYAGAVDGLGPTGEFRIEWVDSSLPIGSEVIGATPNTVVAGVTGGYVPFSVTGTAPAGADTARVVNAAITFGAPTGSVFVDDVGITGTFIPEPSTALLGAFGMLGLLARRRR